MKKPGHSSPPVSSSGDFAVTAPCGHGSLPGRTSRDHRERIRREVILVGGLILCALLLQADFQPSSWKYRRPLSDDPAVSIDPDTLHQPRVAVLNVDRGTYIHSNPDLADLRVTSGLDEVPYVIEKMSGSHRQTEVSSGALNQGVNASGDLELTVDVGTDQRHNGLRLSTTRINFRQKVSVSTSDDGRNWMRVRDDGYIFDFSQDQRQVSVLNVGYPISTRRYVRLTVYGWNDPKAVLQCFVTLEENKPPIRDLMATLKVEPQQEAKTQSTLFTWDLGLPGIPHDQLMLDVDTPAFQRAAAVESSQDGKDWSFLGLGVLSRFRKEQSLTLDFPESHNRYLRLRVYNRDDRPLAVKAAALNVIRSRVKFKLASGGSYWLYYGNQDAHAPSYDLRELLAREAPAPEAAFVAGTEETNPAYREKPPPVKPWSEQHPTVLYVTLALAVLGMGTVTVRFLKKAGAEIRQ
jgi:hypothetical protein